MNRNFSLSGRLPANNCLRECTDADDLICRDAMACNKGLHRVLAQYQDHMLEHGQIKMKENQIDSLFAFADIYSPLYGGRMAGEQRAQGHDCNLNEANIKWLNERGIGIKLTLTNPHFTLEKYEKSKELLDKYHYAPNMVLTTSNEFAESVRKDYPNYKVEASVINGFDTVEKLNEVWDLYDTIVLPIICNGRPDGSHMMEGIDNLKHPEKIRLFMNVECSYTCPQKLCYSKMGLINEKLADDADLGRDQLVNEFQSGATIPDLKKMAKRDAHLGKHACSAWLGKERIFHQDEMDWSKFYFPLERFQQFGINKWKILISNIHQGRWNLMYKKFYTDNFANLNQWTSNEN